MPYSTSLSISEQVHASVASSLRNLSAGETTYLDCVLMHSPLPKLGGTVLAWNTLSTYVASGKIRHLGIANVTLPVLMVLVNDMEVKPAVVQNRFYADTRYEVPMRKFCREHGIVFQSFWTLTGNPGLLRTATVAELGEKAGVAKEVALYALVVGLKWVTVLDGTTNAQRMKGDLEGLEKVGKWVMGQGRDEWDRIHQEFMGLIGEI
jgi:diketogulonate reductase-like aldo/keto reductase